MFPHDGIESRHVKRTRSIGGCANSIGQPCVAGHGTKNGCTIYDSYNSAITGICLTKNMYMGMLLKTSVEPVRVQHERRDKSSLRCRLTGDMNN
jgi:hypothetical protein